MTAKDRIAERLTKGLAPESIEVIDESHRHAGHAGARPGGETHFRIKIVSASFAGKRSVERHRMIYDLLQPEIAAGVHALAMTTLTPEESGRG
jgi:BolA family transcriptional regulator, general stress-responsive regulator